MKEKAEGKQMKKEELSTRPFLNATHFCASCSRQSGSRFRVQNAVFNPGITVNHGKSRWIKGGGPFRLLHSAFPPVRFAFPRGALFCGFLRFFAEICDHIFYRIPRLRTADCGPFPHSAFFLLLRQCGPHLPVWVVTKFLPLKNKSVISAV